MILGIESRVDVHKGKANVRRDRKCILDAFTEEPGGISAVNETINGFLKDGILHEYTEYSMEYIGKYHLCLAQKKVVG
jgi:hypothetical protein